MKVLLINQNPVIKKLVGMASKKLNLEIENVARIAPDFNPKEYICIIVDDENVGKNLEKLTSLQDQVKVCLLFARKTQIKKHEFNIAIQKPFLPTDILEILNECIPKEGEAKAHEEVNNSALDGFGADSINEIDMDLKSAEITPPEGIDLNTMNLQKEAEEIANEDTDEMLDFDPDSLDFSNLEKAGEVAADEEQDENSAQDKKDTQDVEADLGHEDSNIDIEESNDENSSDTEEHKVGSLFDSDLSDLKPSGNPLDLANFDLDSIVDSSALKAASLGVAINEEAQEAASNIGDDDDDLFLSDDERDLLQPSPKKFLQAKEEEARKEKELEEEEPQEEKETQSIESDSIQEDIAQENALTMEDSIKKEARQELGDEEINLDNLLEEENIAEGEQEKTELQDFAPEEDTIQKEVQTNQQQTEEDSAQDSNDLSLDSLDTTEDNLDGNIDLESLTNNADDTLNSLDVEATIPQDESMQDIDEKQTDMTQIQLDDMDIVDNLNAALDTQVTPKGIEGTLDDVFDDLTAALNSAFDNMVPQETQTDETATQDSIPHDDEAMEDIAIPQGEWKDSEEKEEVIDDILADSLLEDLPTNETKEPDTEIMPQGTKADEIVGALESEIIEQDDLAINILQEEDVLAQDNNADTQVSNTQSVEENTHQELGIDDLESLELEGSATEEPHKGGEDSMLEGDSALDFLEDDSLMLDMETTQTKSTSPEISEQEEQSKEETQPTIFAPEALAEINDALLEINDGPKESQEESKKDSQDNEIMQPDITESTQDMDLDSLLADTSENSTDSTTDDDALLADLLKMPLDSEIDDKEQVVSENRQDKDMELNLQHDFTEELAEKIDANTLHNLETMDALLQDEDSEQNEDLLAEAGQIDTEEAQPASDSIPTSQDELDFTESLDMQPSTPTIAKHNAENEEEQAAMSNEDLLYVALPSNEENIENLTETELAEALGEGDENIVRLSQAFDEEADQTPAPQQETIEYNKEESKETENMEMKSMEDSMEESIEETPDTNDMQIEDTISMSLESAEDIPEKTETIAQDISPKDIKKMNADLLIDFFKNTPKEKLHEIFDGSEINFSIHFGKSEK